MLEKRHGKMGVCNQSELNMKRDIPQTEEGLSNQRFFSSPCRSVNEKRPPRTGPRIITSSGPLSEISRILA